MPDLLTEMVEALPPSDFDRPLAEWNGWRLFADPDGFLPSAHNLLLVLKLFAWKRGVDHYYACAVGNDTPSGVIRYTRGQEINAGFVSGCSIDAHFYFTHGKDRLVQEVESSLFRLLEFVKESELILA